MLIWCWFVAVIEGSNVCDIGCGFWGRVFNNVFGMGGCLLFLFVKLEKVVCVEV